MIIKDYFETEAASQDLLRFEKRAWGIYSDILNKREVKRILWLEELVAEKGHVPKCILVENAMRKLNGGYFELVRKYAYSVAADEIANGYDRMGKTDFGGYWRYHVRNFHFMDFWPRYFSFLDYAANAINEMSNYKLCEDILIDRTQTYQVYDMLQAYHACANKIGLLEQRDRHDLTHFLYMMDVEDDESLGDLLKTLRNKITHKYLPGIDHIAPGWAPSLFSDTRKKKFSDIHDLALKGTPEYKFEELEPIAKQLLFRILEALDFLQQTPFVQSCIERIEFMKDK